MSSPAQTGPGPAATAESSRESSTDLDRWRDFWVSGQALVPEGTRRGVRGRLQRLLRRLLRPLLRASGQTAFNLAAIEHLGSLDQARRDLHRDLLEVRGDLLRDVQNNHRRISHLEAFKRDGFGDVMRHSDALYAVVDQKLDRYRRESQALWSRLGALLARVPADSTAAEERRALSVGWDEQSYLGLEHRFRGTSSEIAERVAAYLPHLTRKGEVLDLGCGRGETLEVLSQHGFQTRGVDLSAEMVAECVRRGLSAERADLLTALDQTAEASLAAVISLHVIEHLPAAAVGPLVRLSWRALAPGGALILETPNPLSIVVAARNFWRDPTHLRPIHPETLKLLLEQAGFDPVERLDLQPFADGDRLPELELKDLPQEQRVLAERINALRDQLDELLFGYQDVAVIGKKPS